MPCSDKFILNDYLNLKKVDLKLPEPCKRIFFLSEHVAIYWCLASHSPVFQLYRGV
jgi:hypothetical protein